MQSSFKRHNRSHSENYENMSFQNVQPGRRKRMIQIQQPGLRLKVNGKTMIHNSRSVNNLFNHGFISDGNFLNSLVSKDEQVNQEETLFQDITERRKRFRSKSVDRIEKVGFLKRMKKRKSQNNMFGEGLESPVLGGFGINFPRNKEMEINDEFGREKGNFLNFSTQNEDKVIIKEEQNQGKVAEFFNFESIFPTEEESDGFGIKQKTAFEDEETITINDIDGMSDIGEGENDFAKLCRENDHEGPIPSASPREDMDVKMEEIDPYNKDEFEGFLGTFGKRNMNIGYSQPINIAQSLNFGNPQRGVFQPVPNHHREFVAPIFHQNANPRFPKFVDVSKSLPNFHRDQITNSFFRIDDTRMNQFNRKPQQNGKVIKFRNVNTFSNGQFESKPIKNIKSKRTRKTDKKKGKYNVGFWSEKEHNLFLQGYNKYGRKWVNISREFVKTRNRTQCASHAQKFFQKIDKKPNK